MTLCALRNQYPQSVGSLIINYLVYATAITNNQTRRVLRVQIVYLLWSSYGFVTTARGTSGVAREASPNTSARAFVLQTAG